MKVYQFILHRPSNVFGGINSLQPKMSLILFGGWDLGSYLSLIPTRAIRSLVQNVHPPHPFKPICACFKFTRMAVLLSITFTHLRFRASLLKMHTLNCSPLLQIMWLYWNFVQTLWYWNYKICSVLSNKFSWHPFDLSLFSFPLVALLLLLLKELFILNR